MYKLLYLSADGIRNVIRILEGRDLKHKIVKVGRIEHKISSIKVALEKEIVHEIEVACVDCFGFCSSKCFWIG